jgi:hypothetical protein
MLILPHWRKSRPGRTNPLIVGQSLSQLIIP